MAHFISEGLGRSPHVDAGLINTLDSPRLASQLHPISNFDMTIDPNLGSKSDLVSKFGTASDARKRHDDAVFAYLNIMPNLDEVIDLSPFSDYSSTKSSPVDARVCTNLYVVLQDNDA